MKQIILLYLIIFSIFISCEKENQPPTCNISIPNDGAKILRGEKVTISVNANDPDGTIEGVRIYIAGKSYEATNTNPYSLEWDTKDESVGDIEIKALAVDDGLLEAESEISVTIEIKEASVLTKEVTDITHNSAMCAGDVTDNGGSKVRERGICWGTNSNPTKSDNKKTAGTGLGEFSVELSELESDTTYYYRAYAVNEKDVTYGEEKSFSTNIEIILATVETNDVENIDESSATINGNIISNGNGTITTRGFYWSNSDSSPDENDNIEIVQGSLGAFNFNITGLEPNTKYYYRCFAKNEKGETKGTTKNFTTLAAFPSVETYDATMISVETAVLNGEITEDGNTTITSRGFYWSNTNVEPDESNNVEKIYGKVGTIEKSLRYLEENTQYHYRTFATNKRGTAMGTVKTFLTASNTTPILNTSEPTNISSCSATLNGVIDSDGGLKITERGFYLSNSNTSPDENDMVIIRYGTIGNLSHSIFSLEQNETYYYRIFATNSIGTALGEVESFRTNEYTYVEGELLDIRDNKTYKTVKIGGQVWMAENLACYAGKDIIDWDYNDENKFSKYGRLYPWEVAKNICPDGWHLPSDSEWEQLAKTISTLKGPYSKQGERGDWLEVGKHLKARTGWPKRNGTDDFNFKALPGGFLGDLGFDYFIGSDGYWWSSTESSQSEAWCRWLSDLGFTFMRLHYPKHYYFSVRCVKN